MYTMGIYGIYDSTTNACLYIGCSKEIEKRYVKYHLARLANGTHLRKDFSEWYRKQTTPDPTYLKVLEKCESVDELNPREVFWFLREKPKYFGKLPSESERWKYSEDARRKLSIAAKSRLEHDPESFGWSTIVKKYGEQRAKEMIATVGFDSKTGAEAGRKGKGRRKSEDHKAALSKAALLSSSNILHCETCQQECKGPSALGLHRYFKHKIEGP